MDKQLLIDNPFVSGDAGTGNDAVIPNTVEQAMTMTSCQSSTLVTHQHWISSSQMINSFISLL